MSGRRESNGLARAGPESYCLRLARWCERYPRRSPEHGELPWRSTGDRLCGGRRRQRVWMALPGPPAPETDHLRLMHSASSESVRGSLFGMGAKTSPQIRLARIFKRRPTRGRLSSRSVANRARTQPDATPRCCPSSWHPWHGFAEWPVTSPGWSTSAAGRFACMREMETAEWSWAAGVRCRFRPWLNSSPRTTSVATTLPRSTKTGAGPWPRPPRGALMHVIAATIRPDPVVSLCGFLVHRRCVRQRLPEAAPWPWFSGWPRGILNANPVSRRWTPA